MLIPIALTLASRVVAISIVKRESLVVGIVSEGVFIVLSSLIVKRNKSIFVGPMFILACGTVSIVVAVAMGLRWIGVIASGILTSCWRRIIGSKTSKVKLVTVIIDC